jgi:hypothetical protein
VDEKAAFPSHYAVNAGDMIGLVPIASDAGKRVIRWIFSAAARGRHDVLDVIRRASDDLRSAAILTAGFGSLGDKDAFSSRCHLGGNCRFARLGYRAVSRAFAATALCNEHARIFNTHSVRFVTELGKFLSLTRRQFSVVVLRHQIIKPCLGFRIETAQLRTRFLEGDQIAQLDVAGTANGTGDSQIHLLQWLVRRQTVNAFDVDGETGAFERSMKLENGHVFLREDVPQPRVGFWGITIHVVMLPFER